MIWQGELIKEITWKMTGLFNARNLSMAILASSLACARTTHTDDSMFNNLSEVDFSQCRGVKRRQEVLFDHPSLVILSDFAHHPTAITGALESLHSRYPNRKIIACFEPRSNTAVTNVFEDRFAHALSLAEHTLIEVFIGQKE